MKRKPTRATDWIPAIVLGVGMLAILSLFGYKGFQIIRASSSKSKTAFRENFPGLEAAASLSADQKRRVIEWANQERCSCKCGYMIAGCLTDDKQCPLRQANLERVKAFVEASRAKS